MVSNGGARSGTATIVFTDLVDSTELRARLGDDEADEIRRQHDALLAAAVAQHGGAGVKGTGDGVMAAFSGAADAVAAAVAMQRGIGRLGRRRPLALTIRVGMSAGDVVWEDGDCFGTPVVEAARLCDAAQPGQILAADVVRMLAGSRGGHSFTPAGAVALKGIPEPLVASEVAWEVGSDATLPLPGPLAVAEPVGFVGRAAELDRLSAARKAARTDGRRVVLVAGEPGVGKTRLVAEAARAAHAEGAAVLFGRCDEELAVAYQPFAEALRHYVLHCPDTVLDRAGPWLGELARLVPAVEARRPGLPAPVRADPESERQRLFEAVTALLEAATAAQQVVLVLDDLHWAAKPTLLLLRHVVRTELSAELVVVATYRDTDLARTSPLAELLADLRREPGVERISLRGLGEREVTELIAATAGSPIDDGVGRLARELFEETEGNPFFLDQVLHHLLESGAIERRDGTWVRTPGVAPAGIPEGVREVVGRRLSRLSAAANAVLAAGAVVGTEFDLDLVTAASGLPRDEVLDGLEQAEESRLVEGVADRRARYAFVHALVRSTLVEEIPTTRRLRLHRDIARALEGRAAGPDAHVEELARHYCEAAALGDVDRAVEYSRRAGRRALDRLAYEEAAAIYERAIDVLDPADPAWAAVRAELLVALGSAQWAVGERERARRASAAAVALARSIGRPDLIVDACLVVGGTRGWVDAGIVEEELLAGLREALTMLPEGDSPHRARAMARLGCELYFVALGSEERLSLSERAVAMARRLADDEVLCYTLSCAHWGTWVPGNAEDRLVIAEELLAAARRCGNREFLLSGLEWSVVDLWELGDIERLDERLEESTVVAAELRKREWLWSVGVRRTARLLSLGRLDEARRAADEALATGQALGSPTALQMYGVQQLALARLTGGLEPLVPLVQSMVDEYPLVPAWRTGLLYIHRELGNLEELRREFDTLAADGFAAIPFDANWTVAMEILGLAAAELRDREQAAVLYDLLLPFARFNVLVGMPADSVGSMEKALALLAATLERWDDFEHHGRAGIEADDRNGNVPWAATARLDVARVLCRRRWPGDAERAAALLDEAAAMADAHGFSRLTDLIARARAT